MAGEAEDSAAGAEKKQTAEKGRVFLGQARAPGFGGVRAGGGREGAVDRGTGGLAGDARGAGRWGAGTENKKVREGWSMFFFSPSRPLDPPSHSFFSPPASPYVGRL